MKKNEIPTIDLHCDFLSFLTHRSDRSIEDPASRTSYAQLKQGRIKLQTLAIFSTTQNASVENGRKQIEQYLLLSKQYPMHFTPSYPPTLIDGSQISIIPAFENASAFSAENEPLAESFNRLESYLKLMGPVFYISMTWNEENRFGGGNMTTVGLKEDGKRLLEWMHQKRIAIDLSHTSDKLAYDIIECIDRYMLDIPLIASHSNFRIISDWQRNLPEDLAKEVIRRQGLIGLNFFAPFIHSSDPSAIYRHVEYALALGAENALCFGADFFCDIDFPSLIKKYQRKEAFYPEFSNASFYPTFLESLENQLKLNQEQLAKIAHQNAIRFLEEKIYQNK